MVAPFNPTVRRFDVIVRELPRRVRPGKQLETLTKRLRGRVTADYLSVLRRLGRMHEFAVDFRFLGPRDLVPENSLRECPKVGLGEKWWLFATSGAGDGWLLRCSMEAAEVAFLDHNRESKAEPELLGIEFNQWIQLADLMRQVERAEASSEAVLDAQFRLRPAARRLVKGALAAISPSLPTRYPYRV